MKPTLYAQKWHSFDGDSKYRRNPEQALWSEVLYTAFDDLAKAIRHSKKKLLTHEAYLWFFNNDKHLYFVCQCAGFDPDFIKTCARRIVDGKKEFKIYRRPKVVDINAQ